MLLSFVCKLIGSCGINDFSKSSGFSRIPIKFPRLSKKPPNFPAPPKTKKINLKHTKEYNGMHFHFLNSWANIIKRNFNFNNFQDIFFWIFVFHFVQYPLIVCTRMIKCCWKNVEIIKKNYENMSFWSDFFRVDLGGVCRLCGTFRRWWKSHWKEDRRFACHWLWRW